MASIWEQLGLWNAGTTAPSSYTLKADDTVSALGKKYGFSTADFAKANGLSDDFDYTKMQIGDSYKLPTTGNTEGGFNLDGGKAWGTGIMSLLGAAQGHQMYRLGKKAINHQMGIDDQNLVMAKQDSDKNNWRLQNYYATRGDSAAANTVNTQFRPYKQAPKQGVQALSNQPNTMVG